MTLEKTYQLGARKPTCGIGIKAHDVFAWHIASESEFAFGCIELGKHSFLFRIGHFDMHANAGIIGIAVGVWIE